MVRRKIESRRVIVTGASSGIGFELARLLLRKGCRVLATARRRERLEALATEVDAAAELLLVDGDITDPRLRQELVTSAQRQWGGLDILINNAGLGALGRFEDSTEQSLRKVMEVNFFAPVELIRVALPLLKQGQQPLVVNISSVLAHRAVPEKSEYCASKFALHGFSDAIRAELAGEVDVLLVSPSTTDSEFFDQAVDNQSQRDWTPKHAMSPAQVASKTVKAIQSGKHEVILSWGGRGLVWIDRLAPTLTNKLVAKYG